MIQPSQRQQCIAGVCRGRQTTRMMHREYAVLMAWGGKHIIRQERQQESGWVRL